jgi:hypothetical protein
VSRREDHDRAGGWRLGPENLTRKTDELIDGDGLMRLALEARSTLAMGVER